MKNITARSNFFEDNFLLTMLFLSWQMIPKVDLINIPNYSQGLRVEDFLLFLVVTSLFIKRASIPFYGGVYGFRFIIYMMMAPLTLGILSSTAIQSLVFTIRWAEYFVVAAILIKYISKNLNFYINFCKLHIFYNFVYAIIGFFVSTDTRYQGFTAGPWEVGTLVLINYTILIGCIDARSRLIYGVMCALVLFASSARIQIGAFLILIFLISPRALKVWFLSGIIIVLSYFHEQVLNTLRVDLISFESLSQTIHYVSLYSKEDFLGIAGSGEYLGDPSLLERLLIWKTFYSHWLQFLPLSLLIGTGAGSSGVVADGLWMRLFFEFGLIGFIFVVWFVLWSSRLSYQVKLLMIIFAVVSVTNDPLTSSRLFVAFAVALGFLKIKANMFCIQNKNIS